MSLKYLVLFATIVSLHAAIAEDAPKSDRSEYKKSLSRDCTTSYSTTCLKLDIVSWVDKLNEDDNFSVFPGVNLVKEKENSSSASANTAEIVADLARDFPNDPEARLDGFLMKKVGGYLDTHAIKLNLFDEKSVETARRRGGGKKGGGGMGGLLAAAALMKGTLMALALGGLAALAGKALMTGLISLLLSAIIGLKSLTSGGGKQTTYEVISKPVYTHSQSHSSGHEEGHSGHYGHSSYGRSFDVPLPLGLQPDYKPQ